VPKFKPLVALVTCSEPVLAMLIEAAALTATQPACRAPLACTVMGAPMVKPSVIVAAPSVSRVLVVLMAGEALAGEAL
jgi:hypothetical protein